MITRRDLRASSTERACLPFPIPERNHHMTATTQESATAKESPITQEHTRPADTPDASTVRGIADISDGRGYLRVGG